MDFCMCYGEVQVEVKCRAPVGMKVRDLGELPTVSRTRMFVAKVLGVEGEEGWEQRVVPQVDADKMTAKAWCNFGGSSLIFSPACNNPRRNSRIHEQAALYRALPVQDRRETLLADSREAKPQVEQLWKSVLGAAAASSDNKAANPGAEELSFWVVYAEAWEDVAVVDIAAAGSVHMQQVYKIGEGIEASKRLLKQLQMEQGRIKELKMRFIPELRSFKGGPSAAQWAKFKSATVLFCEDPETEHSQQEGALYKQAALYRKFLQLRKFLHPVCLHPTDQNCCDPGWRDLGPSFN